MTTTRSPLVNRGIVMSTVNRTDSTHTTDTTGPTARTLRSVPDHTTTSSQRTDAKDKLWEALHATPNSTTTDLAAAAVIGKSTAAKILAKWEADGSAIRTPGIAPGGRRAADLWAIAEATHAAPDDTADDMDGTDTVTAATSADDGAVTGPTVTSSDKQLPDPTPDPAEVIDTTAAVANVSELGTARPVAAIPDSGHDTPGTPVALVPGEVQDAVAEVVSEEVDLEDGGTTPADVPQTASGGIAAVKTGRLASGALRGMVEDHLRDHPDEQFSPVAIAKALGGKSSGAVSNALDKLVDDGVAAKTQDKPRRFALAPAQQAAAVPPAN
jgi:hypothetical protein